MGPDKIGHIDFSKMDAVVKDAIRKFLPIETLTNSAATSKLFNAMMNDKGTWVKLAKQLNIKPVSADTAKAEVITRLKAHSYAMQYCYAMQYFPETSQKKLKACKDPIELQELIKKEISSLPENDYDKLLTKFCGLLKEKTPDSIQYSTILLLLQEGIMAKATTYHWASSFRELKQRHEEKAFTLCQEDFKVYIALLKQLNESKKVSPKDKSSLMQISSEYFFKGDRFPVHFLDEIIKVGIMPTEDLLKSAYQNCTLNQLIKKEGPLYLITSYAPNKASLLPEFQLMEQKLREEINGNLKQNFSDWFHTFQFPKFSTTEGKESDITEKCVSLYKYIHGSEIAAALQGNGKDPKVETERRAWVLQLIEQAEAQMLQEFQDPLEEDIPLINHLKNSFIRYKEAALK